MTTWQHWVNFILGLWILVSAFIPFTGNGLTINLVLVGIIVAVLAIWGAIQINSLQPARRM